MPASGAVQWIALKVVRFADNSVTSPSMDGLKMKVEQLNLKKSVWFTRNEDWRYNYGFW